MKRLKKLKTKKYKQQVKQKRLRGPNKLYSTDAARALYAGFVKPFFAAFTIHPDQDHWREGLEAFFNISTRHITWCRVEQSFYMPGAMWASLSHPFVTIHGTGARYVAQGKDILVRVDDELPDRNEVEFDDQVFILSDAELSFIKEKIKPVA